MCDPELSELWRTIEPEVGNDFHEQLLRRIAEATGVSYEALSQDFVETDQSRIAASMWRLQQARSAAEREALRQQFRPFALRIWGEIKMAYQIATVCGYNPQLLLPAPTFTCEMCGGTFGKAWSDEEAEAEKVELFPLVAREDCAMICDDCFNRVMGPRNLDFEFRHRGAWEAAMANAVYAITISDLEYVPATGEIVCIGPASCGKTEASIHRFAQSGGQIADVLRDIMPLKELRPAPDYLKHDPTKRNKRRPR